MDLNPYGIWIFNDDEMYESLTGNMTISSITKLSEPSYTFLSPVPSFTGKWATSFGSSNLRIEV